MLRTVAGRARSRSAAPQGARRSGRGTGGVGDGVDAAADARGVRLVCRRPGESLYLLGIDSLGSPVWRAQFPRQAIDIPDELAFLAQPDSIVVTRQLAKARGLTIGAQLMLTFPNGRRALTVEDRSTTSMRPSLRWTLGSWTCPPPAWRFRAGGQVARILATLAPTPIAPACAPAWQRHSGRAPR
jgi:hypothetical protein